MFQDNERNDRFNKMNELFKTTNGTIISKQRSDRLRKGMEQNDRFNTTERNDRFNTTEWNGIIALTQRNGTERSFYHNGKEGNRNRTAVAVLLHGIQMGTFIDAYCISFVCHDFVDY